MIFSQDDKISGDLNKSSHRRWYDGSCSFKSTTSLFLKTLYLIFFNCHAQAYNKRISPKHVSVKKTIYEPICRMKAKSKIQGFLSYNSVAFTNSVEVILFQQKICIAGQAAGASLKHSQLTLFLHLTRSTENSAPLAGGVNCIWRYLQSNREE